MEKYYTIILRVLWGIQVLVAVFALPKVIGGWTIYLTRISGGLANLSPQERIPFLNGEIVDDLIQLTVILILPYVLILILGQVFHKNLNKEE